MENISIAKIVWQFHDYEQWIINCPDHRQYWLNRIHDHADFVNRLFQYRFITLEERESLMALYKAIINRN